MTPVELAYLSCGVVGGLIFGYLWAIWDYRHAINWYRIDAEQKMKAQQDFIKAKGRDHK